MKINFKNNKGFSLFIALTASSALLLVAFVVSNIVTKGLEFANTSRDSQIAFFAADAGVECALYWDVILDPSKFATSTSGSPIVCAMTNMETGVSIIPGTTTATLIGGGGSGNPTSAFGFVMDQGANPSDACVIVTVNKQYVGPNLVTTISSYGYNTCDLNVLRRVERGVNVTY